MFAHSRPAAHRILEVLLICVTCLHVILVPFTGSEELWYHQTIHDLLRLDFRDAAQLAQYSHFTFPELQTIPRSFIGPAILAVLSWPFRSLAARLGFPAFFVEQISIRLVLAIYSASSLVFLARRAQGTLGVRTSEYFLLVSALQFHLPFWMGRAVPNMAAFGATQVALAWIMFPKASKTRRLSSVDVVKGLCLMAILAIILRLEILGLLVPLALQALVSGSVALKDGLFYGIVASSGAATAFTMLVDSYFWGRLLWPEASQFIWNVIEGRSESYGTLPFYAYALLFLPKILLMTYPLAIYAMANSCLARKLAVPVLGQVLLMSCLRHKEWRFCCYVIPSLNLVAMKGLSDIRSRHKRLGAFILLAICSASLLYTFGALYVSSTNYTGGKAMLKLDAILRHHAIEASSNWPTVNVDWYACVTGALDSQVEPRLALLTKRNHTSNIENFDYRITHEPHLFEEEYKVLEAISGWADFETRLPEWRPSFKRPRESVKALLHDLPVKLLWKEKVWILGRKDRHGVSQTRRTASKADIREAL